MDGDAVSVAAVTVMATVVLSVLGVLAVSRTLIESVSEAVNDDEEESDAVLSDGDAERDIVVVCEALEIAVIDRVSKRDVVIVAVAVKEEAAVTELLMADVVDTDGDGNDTLTAIVAVMDNDEECVSAIEDVGVGEADEVIVVVRESEVEVVGDAVALLSVMERLMVELKDAETVTVILSETVALMVEHLQLG